jgi:diacylglycerol O-acyltransferase
MAKEPQRLARRVRDMQRGLGTLARDLPPTPPTVLNGPLGPGRSWWGASVPMARVAEIRERHAVTVNDVALAAIAGGLRDLLSAHGESLEGREVRSLVPVSLRTGTDGALHNHVAAMVADLPVLVEDPVERLHEVHRRLVALKSSHEAEVTATAVDAAKHLPWLAVATGFSMATRYLHTFVQRNINTVTTNVPGPDVPLYWMRRRILESWPVTPIGESVRVGVAIHSYAGAMTFGVTTDRASVPDGAVLARGIEREVMAMADAASLPPQAAPVTVP